MWNDLQDTIKLKKKKKKRQGGQKCIWYVLLRKVKIFSKYVSIHEHIKVKQIIN